MAFSHQIKEEWAGNGLSITKTGTYTDSGQVSVDEDVADSETDYEIAFVMDVSEIASIYINSTQDVTFETNLGNGTDTIPLTADKPYVWTSDSYYTNILDTDVTAVFITNASGSTATIRIECVYDVTP